MRVAIDGVDAAGKTTLANDLAVHLERLNRPVIRASLDGFHRPRVERYRRGSDFPEGYYEDSFDYESLVEELLAQLGPGGALHYRSATFDPDSDVFLYEPLRAATSNAILLFDGVFLMRPELNDHWDFRVFVHVEFDKALRRARIRDATHFGSVEAMEERYQTRFIPCQRIYLAQVKPHEKADVIVDNSDVARPTFQLASGHV